ncbi:MAG: ADP-ribosylglycohydrolase family protein [Bacteroidales bacterium]|nr:ADP-ribosylglycohydrolase family protein [Bacteroidales bacterium]
MKKLNIGLFAVILLLAFSACKTKQTDVLTITPEKLKDKIAGGWAGKMIGVTYGAPTEFRAQGKTFDDSIKWTPKDIRGSMWQDDIYVQLTFMMTMDKYGINAPAKKFQEMFAKAGYMLWHANVQARKNYYDSIFPPASGSPEFNSHADDIDFQIEADYLGFMCPGMPVTASKMADKIGHIMNYGDGVYGGIFLVALNSIAFFESDIPKVIDEALKSIPAQSDYAKMVADVIVLHKHYPNDWRASWAELQAKWGNDHFCGSGSDFNIDAKLNGAYIVMGLLYGDGDPQKTMEISTRCGQDSDCNPSSAMAVLGVIIGFDKLPREMKSGVTYMADSLFINTDYSFNKAVDNTFNYATKLIAENGGKVDKNEITIAKQLPEAPALEVSFPNVVLDRKIPVFDKAVWTFIGNWQTLKKMGWPQNELVEQSKFAGKQGDAIEISFSGTGISIDGNWVKDGGKADVYLDGKLIRTIDTYFYYNKQEHDNITIWHVTGLTDSQHKVKLVVKGEKKPESLGTKIYITNAVIYKTAPKKSASYTFTFEK